MRPHENQNGRPGRILTMSIVVPQESERLPTIFRFSIELINEFLQLIANLRIRELFYSISLPAKKDPSANSIP